MDVFIAREADRVETRVALVPAGVSRLCSLGCSVAFESGLGESIWISDDEYVDAGGEVSRDRLSSLSRAGLVLRLGPPPLEDVAAMKAGAIHVSYLAPFERSDLLSAFASAGVSALSMELIPRSTIAQKMDSLSSQASLAGYEAVILAASRLRKVFPMMMTPAGTISPARVFVIGAGVAGLQAIATARRLGARVEAFDTRPAVKEQVESLGGRFVEVDLGETSENKDGYAKALTEEQLAVQRQAMAKHCSEADVVITTAQVFGKRAPLIVTDAMVKGMRPGSIVVDLAVESGGNVAGSQVGEEVVVGGVTLVGLANVPGLVSEDSSLMYSNNVVNLVEHFWDKELQALPVDREDEIFRGCLLTHGGAVVHPAFRERFS